MSITTARKIVPRAAGQIIIQTGEGDGDAPPVRIPATAFTQHGFRAWATSDEYPVTGRVSYLDGEIWIDLSPETIDTHTLIKSEIGYCVVGIDRKEKRGLYMGDGVLLTHEGAGLSTEPDALFALWTTLEAGRLEFVPRKKRRDLSKEVRGTPDWVLEIVSDSSVLKDTERLRELYSRAGIPEYWLVDARADELDFAILVLGDQGYEQAQANGKWQHSPLFGRKFRLDRRRGRMNMWEYMLHYRRAK